MCLGMCACVWVGFTVEAERDMEDLVRCCHCNNLMKNPVLLPCLDALCERHLAESSYCPKCGEALEMSSEDIPKYKDRFLSRQVEIRRVSSAPHAEERCDLCVALPNNESLADYYCMFCSQSLCVGCQSRHQLGRTTKSHAVVKFGTQLSDEVIRDNPSRPHCNLHQKIDASWWCNQCELFFCQPCHGNHSNHETMNLDNFLQILQPQFEDTLSSLKLTTASTMKAALDEKQAKKDKIGSETKRVTYKVKKSKNDMMRVLKEKAMTLHNEANSLCTEQHQWLDEQYEDWKSTSPSLRARRRLITFAEALLAKGSIDEQLTSFKSLSERLAKLKEAECELPELTSKNVAFKPSANFEEPLVGTIKADISDSSIDSGM